MTYPGGKNGAGVYQQIINQMPPHSLYIEAFLGGGAVLQHKRPARSSIAIDSDPDPIAAYGEAAGVTFICDDAITWLTVHNATFGDDTMIYCDPPYLMDTRHSQRPIYKYEMTILQHRQLLRVLRSLDCYVILSGYWSQLYAAELFDWRTVTYQTQTRGGGTATEWLWLNYPEPIELHDYRYLGNNFREREKLKRRKNRWINRLQHMPAIERYAMLDALSTIATNGEPGRTAGSGEGGRPRQV